MIVSWKEIKRALQLDLIHLINCPDCNEIACQIGEHWFYFDTHEDMWYRQQSAEAYTDIVGEDTIAEMIANAMLALSTDSPDEFLYYYFFLAERGIQVIINGGDDLDALIANARSACDSDEAPGSLQTGMDKHNTYIHKF